MTWRGGLLFPGITTDDPCMGGEKAGDPVEPAGETNNKEAAVTIYTMTIHIYTIYGHLNTFVTNDNGCTLWDVATMIRHTHLIARKDQHLILGILEPPASATLTSLVPGSNEINLTLVISNRTCRCGLHRPQHACGACRSVWYCSDACATAGWDEHRAECRRTRRLVNWAQLYQDYLAESVLHI